MATSRQEPYAVVKSGSPTWVKGSYRQTFTVEASEAIPTAAFNECFHTAIKLFRGSLAMNGYGPLDFMWPPFPPEIQPSADFKTAVVTLETRAKKPPDQNAPPGLIKN